MKIAELFVELGVRGADKAAGAFSSVRGKISEVTSTSLEAKAAIVGVMYGLERLMTSSGRTGTALTQFTNLTGLAGDQLQRWQFLAMKSGVAGEEMTSAITGIQSAMTKLVLTGQAPKYLNALQQAGLDVDKSKLRDSFYVMDKLREYAQKTKDMPDISNEVLRSFGLSDGVIQALRTSSVDLSKVNPAYMYSKGQTKALNDVNVGWTLLGSKIEHSFGKLNAKWGPGAIKDISKLADQVLKLGDAFAGLADRMQLVAGIGQIFKGWTEIFKDTADLVNNIAKAKKTGNWTGVFGDSDTWKVFAHSMLGDPIKVPAHSGGRSVQANITNHVTIHGVHNPEEVPKHIQKMNNDAFRQIPQGGF